MGGEHRQGCLFAELEIMEIWEGIMELWEGIMEIW